MITVTVLLFAHHADIAGSTRLDLQLPNGSSAVGCAAAIQQKWPALGDLLRTSRVAVGEQFTDTSIALKDGDEVAFIPPVSGG